mmetsp:Transcript_46253/g.142664  ORF Transcript_46253/g.142664 Transcript_46253/m.142664 type:complete len:579 (-) Transcript_46253:85-1821(-)
MTDHFLSVAQMIDDLRADDKELRLVAMRALVTIAQTLGPERTREELVPYVTDYLDEDDNVLRAMAQRFGLMLAEVGGMAHIDTLLGPLETLCTLDEITVRDDAINSINALAKAAFSPAGGSVEAQTAVMNLINRLAGSDHAPSRCSACGLIAGPYAVAPVATRRDLKTVFGKLCEDGEVMVRRAACVALGGSVTAALAEAVGEFIGNFSKFCKDPSDGVRLQTVSAAIAMCPVLNESGVTQVIGLMKTLGNDTAWRVRFMLADKVGALCQVWPQKDAARVGLGLFRTMCSDPAPEIKGAAVFNLDTVARCVANDDARKDALDVAVRLADDASEHVRSCLASVLLKALPHMPKGVITSTIVPTATKLLKDKDAPVRLAVIGSFSTSASTSGADGINEVATSMAPVIVSLAKDTNWRVRETVVQQLPAVVLGGADLSKELIDVCVEALTDRVATIRAAGASACKQLVARQGSQWLTSSGLLPRISALAQSPTYVRRVTLMYAVRQLIDVADAATVRSDLWPIVARMAADPVANVRMNACHAIRAAVAAKKVPAGDAEPLIAKLKGDADVDVRDAIQPPTR